jgi:hypothetical protein
MKQISRQNLTRCMAAACSLVITATITVRAASGNEQIINGPIQGDAVNGTTEWGVASTPSDSYVGDLCPEQAGVSSCSNCRGSQAGRWLGRRSRVSDYASNEGIQRVYGQPDLFYNFYTQGYFNQTNAQMYLSPHPIPPNVGHTFFTYQPFYPHHMLYPHKNRFHRTYDFGRGMNRTHVSYRPAVRQVVCDLYWNVLRLPR